MIKIPKTVMIIAAIIVVVIVVLASVPAYDWDEGAPEMSIVMVIEKVGTEQFASAEYDIGPDGPSSLDSMSISLTTVDVGIPFVEPGATYRINIYTKTNSVPQSTLVTSMSGSVSVSGTSGTGFALADHHKTGVDTTITKSTATIYPNIPKWFNFTADANDRYDIDSVIDPSLGTTTNRRNLLGSDIDNSLITMTAYVVADGYPDIWGSTELIMRLRVGIGGNVDVNFTDVSVTTG